MHDASLLDWLVDSDPALRWQVERDLMGETPGVWEATRARIATEGFGKALLDRQDPDGQWDGGAYFPGDFDFSGPEAAPGAGQPWTATTWTLNTLRDWGLDSAVLRERNTAGLLGRNARWEYDDLPYWGGEVDCCINGYTVANGVWLGADISGIIDWFAQHQMDDGGWNCDWVEGSTRSSFHSTLNSLRGLLASETATGGSPQTRQVRKRAEEYLLERHLSRRLSTGEPVADWVNRYVYPFRWYYSVLNASDYFRQASLHDGTAPDPRMEEAIGMIRAALQPDGRLIQERRHPGRVWFEVDVPAGESSKWLTFYAIRVLDWWQVS